MISAIRVVVDEHWRRLETSGQVTDNSLRLADLPVPTPLGHVAAAVDTDGHRHLLVPLGSHQMVRKGLNGPVLQLRKRALEDRDSYRVYADLGCLREDLNDIFTMLCADVLVATETSPGNPVKALNRVLDRWKALFQNPGPPLGPHELAGLFGELTVLARLLEQDGSAYRTWRGPSGHRHDFTADSAAVEVKTSLTTDGRAVRIHGLDQLEPPTSGLLGLVWLRLVRAETTGIGLLELIRTVLDLADDESAVLSLLASVGYRVADNEHYSHVRFVVDEERWYNVDVAFPRLTQIDLAAAGISASIRDVDYTIDLSSESPAPMSASAVEQLLGAMIEEFA
ncbi:PD-(D/E)XK motif protein [Nocardia cyriacigeorgica]|uniref:PD-(D/E)XK motif protein n=1 Tax=Nocardia cyriacigeorgica TaxID=135487 RepID=UPI0018945ED9|nr:PD-(D/E)XK motif protein [Nocardia cyriacigeorgica]MBF6081147.1 PD-(D/E)XK motif protein [Nocardia cyriacigeorgica]